MVLEAFYYSTVGLGGVGEMEGCVCVCLCTSVCVCTSVCAHACAYMCVSVGSVGDIVTKTLERMGVSISVGPLSE